MTRDTWLFAISLVWCAVLLVAFMLTGSGETSYYSASEKELIKQQLKAGNDRTAEAARMRGYKLHPRLANNPSSK